jgi:hypothetical protein
MVYAQDGDLSQYDDDEIALGADYSGDAAQFRDALTVAGFLDQGATLHNWTERGGKSLRAAESNRERQRRFRQAQKEGVTVTPALRNAVRQDKTRQDKTTADAVVTQGRNGRVDYPDDFTHFWEQYPNHNGSKKAALAQWDRLDDDDRAAAVFAILHWQQTREWRSGYVKHAERYLRDRQFDQEVTDDETTKTDRNGNPTANVFAAAASAAAASRRGRDLADAGTVQDDLAQLPAST